MFLYQHITMSKSLSVHQENKIIVIFDYKLLMNWFKRGQNAVFVIELLKRAPIQMELNTVLRLVLLFYILSKWPI